MAASRPELGSLAQATQASLLRSLLAAALDRERTLEVIVDFFVPQWGDFACVELVDADGSGARHAGARPEEMADLRDRPDRLQLSVALVVGERTLGCLSLAREASGVPYVAHDRAEVRALALPCAQAIAAAEAFRETHEGERRLHAAVDSMDDVAVVLLDPDGRVTSQSAGAQRMLGYGDREILGRRLASLVAADDAAREDADRALRAAAATGRDERETRQVRRDGSVFSAYVVLSRLGDEPESPLGFATVVRDVTERQELEGLLVHQALHDDLTGLPNRTLLLDRMAGALARSERHASAPAVLFVDLDGFKRVNDSLGHAAGDELLVAVAQRLQACVRPQDTVARLGGDEFVVLCEELPGAVAAGALADRITADVAAPMMLGGREVVVQASTGIVVGGGGAATTSDALLRDADTAMYRAKAAGVGCSRVFEIGMRHDRQERLTLEQELRRALHERQLEVHFQPVVDVQTQRIVAAEALVRWQHPERGLLLPGAFIGLAEATGLIAHLDAFVLEVACAEAVRWSEALPGRPPPKVLVNVSGRQVGQAGLVRLIDETLAGSGLDPARLCLEITETVLMSDAPASLSALIELKRLGVQLAIDDFGTGYSSLSYLERFPFDYLKVDRSFIARLGHDGTGSPLTEAMIAMAAALGLSVVAEGVETAEQLAELSRLGCDLAQGFHLARPLPGSAFGVLLQQGVERDAVALPVPRRFEPGDLRLVTPTDRDANR